MSHPDLNLLVTLDAVLSEGSVARAARRLGLSPSAMSRALARLRETTGDPLLVRAGRGLVPTPRAIELRERVRCLADEVKAVLMPAAGIDLAQLERTFAVRTREGFVENFGPRLLALAGAQAPGVRLHFLQKADKESDALRDGSVDLETGVIGERTGPEIRTRLLFRDRWIGVVRPGHRLAQARVTAARYARSVHIGISRGGSEEGPVDVAAAAAGLERRLVTVTGSFSSALALARESDLVASVPERQTARLREGMHSFALPFASPAFSVSMLWHPRLESDPGHRWLRALVHQVCSGEN